MLNMNIIALGITLFGTLAVLFALERSDAKADKEED